MKLSSIQGIPLDYIQSILKIDENSPSNLTWLPRENLRWNSIFANKSAGYLHTHDKDGYRRWMMNIDYNGKSHFVTCSRVIFLLQNGYLTEGKQIDHEDVNSTNNSIDNIREITPDQNQRNRKLQKNNTSGHKGVYWDKRNKKWKVQIFVNGKSHFFGLYEKLEDAIKVAIDARKKLHGEFGRNI